MKTKWMMASRFLMVAVFLLLVPACSSTRPKPVRKAAKMSAKVTLEGGKATGKAVKGAAGVTVRK